MKGLAIGALLITTSACLASEPSGIKYCSSPKKGEPAHTTSSRSCFVGEFRLIDIPGDPDHKLLGANFGFYDKAGLGWETRKDAKTDGASIPPALRPFVGTPWEDGYIRAAVIHDWYCDRKVRPWRETHIVFYDAMLASGLSPSKAKLMFYAVYAFGPIWGYPAQGEACSITSNCIQSVVGGQPYIVRAESYDDPQNIVELHAMEAVINAAELSGGLSLDELMRHADTVHPKPTLYQTRRAVGVDR